jgi:hypothetical protein
VFVAAIALSLPPAVVAAAGSHRFAAAALLPVGHGFGLLFFLLTWFRPLERVLAGESSRRGLLGLHIARLAADQLTECPAERARGA